MRDVKKILENVDINDHYDLDVITMYELLDISQELFDIVCNSFKYSYEMGKRAERIKRKNK